MAADKPALDIDELERLEKAATPGVCNECGGYGFCGEVSRDMALDACDLALEGQRIGCSRCNGSGQYYSEGQQEFDQAIQRNGPALLDQAREAERLRAGIEELRTEHAEAPQLWTLSYRCLVSRLDCLVSRIDSLLGEDRCL